TSTRAENIGSRGTSSRVADTMLRGGARNRVYDSRSHLPIRNEKQKPRRSSDLRGFTDEGATLLPQPITWTNSRRSWPFSSMTSPTPGAKYFFSRLLGSSRVHSLVSSTPDWDACSRNVVSFVLLTWAWSSADPGENSWKYWSPG